MNNRGAFFFVVFVAVLFFSGCSSYKESGARDLVSSNQPKFDTTLAVNKELPLTVNAVHFPMKLVEGGSFLSGNEEEVGEAM